MIKFEHNGTKVEITNEPSGRWHIYGAKCGQKFDIGEIFEPTSVNPILILKGGLGFDLVQAIMSEVRCRVLFEKEDL